MAEEDPKQRGGRKEGRGREKEEDINRAAAGLLRDSGDAGGGELRVVLHAWAPHNCKDYTLTSLEFLPK